MSTTISTTTWKIDAAHSTAEFKVRHMMIAYAKGEFSGVSGTLHLDEADYKHSSVEASIPVASLRTGNDDRDGHLKAADFFDVEAFPTMTFKSTNVRPLGGNDYGVAGDLTIRGVSKPVTLTVQDVSKPIVDPWGNARMGLSCSAKINRKDFGLVWDTLLEGGGAILGDEVTITLEVELIKG